ncbi:hypothetical protein ABZP36_006071 [Zizania latifolia]
MNQFAPDCSNMGDTSRPLGEDDDLIELLWCNGHVVMQSQSHRKLPPRPEKLVAPAPAAAAVQDDEAGLWFPFALADSLDKDILSELFHEAPVAAAAGVDGGGKPCRDEPMADDKRDGSCAASDEPRELMPPPKSTPASCSRQQTMSLANCSDKAGDLSDLVRARTAGASGKAAMQADASSMLSAIGSSICGSNQVQVQCAVSEPGRALPSAVGSANAFPGGRGHEASSSGRSNCGFGITTTTEPTRTSKRQRIDTTTEDSESPSEDAESESAALSRKPPKLLRAAEVHNLSERRRRDRINEKMRALQELIPHCNKTDKASMLDEAIEYLKSLQLQLQMMWMGSSMAPPVMFSGVHQYLQRMPFMAAPQPVPAVPGPPVNPIPLCAPQGHRSPDYRGHMPPAVSLTGQYAQYLGVNHLQPPSQHYAQGVCYYPLETKAVQQNPTLDVVSGRMHPTQDQDN